MKKSLLAFAVLGAFATAASAQSSVTLYGKIDQGVGKGIGTSDKQVFDGAGGVGAGNRGLGTGGSRVGLRGVEDIGGGVKGVFGFEHRFNPDEGTAGSAAQFWNAYSYVGLQTGFGQATLGRHYTAAFLNVQNQVDPFAGETAAALRGVGMLNAAARVRTANSLRYDIAANGFAFAFDIAESQQVVSAALGTATKKPWSVAVSYAGGPVWVALSQEKAGVENVKLTNYGLRYKIGPATLRLGGSSGTLADKSKRTGLLVGANVAMGPGDFKIGYATQKNKTAAGASSDVNKRLGLGYHYNLSKRTKLYFDVARDGADGYKGEDKGYDVGIQHVF